MEQKEVEKILEENLKKSKKTIVIAPGGIDYTTNDNIINYLLKKNNKIAWMTLSFPARILIKRLELTKKQINNLIFIDGASEEKKSEKVKGSFNIDYPESLASLSKGVTELLDSGQKINLFFCESIGTVLSNNKPENVKLFMKYLIKKLNEHGIEYIIFSLKEQIYHAYGESIKPIFDKEIFLLE
ncbi:MAG: hypothetical protein ACMXYG_04140 [Candidatus Woesearchaeota archaeon]